MAIASVNPVNGQTVREYDPLPPAEVAQADALLGPPVRWACYGSLASWEVVDAGGGRKLVGLAQRRQRTGVLFVTGTLVGGLFAAFAFAISVFSVPMLVSSRRDALTAMGTSFAMTVQNLVPMLAWGAIVTAGLAISALTGLLALIVIFPVLGHGTWHAWRAIAQGEE